MDYHFTSEKPIYAQLMDKFKIGILSGEFPKGSKLPSVRELASQASVNPNTMQKALSELERMELVKSERTSGRFITNNEELISSMRKELAETEIKFFLEKMKSLGFAKDEIIQLLQ